MIFSLGGHEATRRGDPRHRNAACAVSRDDSRWRSRSLASNRSRCRSRETSFTPLPVPPEVLQGVHAATGRGVLKRAVERRMQGGSFVGAELVVGARQYV